MKYFNEVSILAVRLEKLGYMFDTYDYKNNITRYVKIADKGAIVFLLFEDNKLIGYNYSLMARKIPHSNSIIKRCLEQLETDLFKLKEMEENERI